MSSSEIQRGSPYQGLIPYSEADAPFFFGREKEARLIIANLFASPLTLLYGASGVGKSSVLRAGVARQLRDREDLLVVVFNSWQSNPLSDLIQAIADQAKLADAAAWSEAMSLMPRNSEASLGEVLAIFAGQLERRLMIILDQFEEYFLYHPLDDEFAAEFSKAVTKAQAPVSFLISIREDFYAKLDRFEGRIPTLYDNYLRIEHLNRKAARIAIEKPIAEYNLRYATNGQFTIEPELVSAVLKQVETGQVIIGEAGRGVIEAAQPHEDADAQIETPFLQLVMTRLWEKELNEGSRKLRLETLKRLGGAENIVRTHLDAVITRLTPREQEVAASIFHYLVTPSGTKIAYSASDLAGSADLDEPEVLGVLEKLSHGDVRILRPVDPPLDRPTAPRYEIFHDVLAPAILTWRTNYVQAQERADAERRAQEQQQRADEQAAIASRFRRLTVVLAVVILLALGTAVFAIAQTVRAKANADRADNYARESEKLRVEGQQLRDEGARLKASGENAQRAAMIAQQRVAFEQRKTQEQIKIAEERKADAEKAQIAASIATSVAAASKLEAKKMTVAANEQARAARAGYANVLALQSRAAGTEFPQRSLLLALEALNQVQPGDPPATAGEGALRQALSQSGGQVFLGHKAEIKNVDISPNNRWLVSSDDSGVTYLWDVDAPAAAPRQLEGADSLTIFSDDNRWLVTGSRDPKTAQKDTTALVWDLGNLASGPRRLTGHEEPVNTAIFAPNKRWLVTGSGFKDLFQREVIKTRVWDLDDPAAKPFVLAGERNLILGISSDQRWLVTEGRDQNNKEGKSVSLWDLRLANPWAKPIILSGQNGQVTNVAFSSDGHWLATAGSNCSFGKDTSVRVWDLTAANPAGSPRVLTAHNRFVSGMAFSPDGKMLVTGGNGVGQATDPCGSDSNSFLWNLTEPTKPPVSLGDIGTPIGFIPIGNDSALITQSTDYATQVRAISEQGSKSFLDLRGAVIGISSDHKMILTMNTEFMTNTRNFARLLAGGALHFPPLNFWRFGDGVTMEPLTLTGHENGVVAARFSQDRRFLVTGGSDKGVRLWKLTNSSFNVAPLTLTEEVDKYGSRLESRWLATKGPDHTVIVSDLAALDPTANPIVLRGHQKNLTNIAVSPDNRWLATSSVDGTVRLWDLSTANPSANAKILRSSPSQMDFTADSRWLITLSSTENQTTINMWDMSATDPSVNSKVWSRPGSSYQPVFLSPDSHWLFDLRNHRSWDVAGLDFSSIDLKAGNVTISPDGAWLVTFENGIAKLRRLKKGELAHTHQLNEAAAAPFVFSPDNRWLLTGPGSQAWLWDLNAANPAAAPWRLSSEVDLVINKAVFSPDNKWVAVGGEHDTVLLWNLRETNPKPFVLKASEGLGNATVSDLDISSDSRWLMTASAANLRIWDLTATNPAAVPVTLPIQGFADAARFTRHDPRRQWLLVRTIEPDIADATVLWNMQTRELVEQACRVAGRNLSPSEWKEYFPDRPYARTCPNLPAEKQ